jgi:peroxiredoxin
LLSDFNKDVSKAYGALYDTFAFDMQGVSKRAAFVIDSEGIIRYAEVLENAGEQPDFKNLCGAQQPERGESFVINAANSGRNFAYQNN